MSSEEQRRKSWKIHFSSFALIGVDPFTCHSEKMHKKDHAYALHEAWRAMSGLFAGFTQVNSPILRLMGSFIPLLSSCTSLFLTAVNLPAVPTFPWLGH